MTPINYVSLSTWTIGPPLSGQRKIKRKMVAAKCFPIDKILSVEKDGECIWGLLQLHNYYITLISVNFSSQQSPRDLAQCEYLQLSQLIFNSSALPQRVSQSDCGPAITQLPPARKIYKKMRDLSICLVISGGHSRTVMQCPIYSSTDRPLSL